MRITDPNFERVKQAADLEAEVSERVAMKPEGNHIKGKCPFHNDKTPSFKASNKKGVCKCFGCQKGGDVIWFVSEYEQITPYQAMKMLAQKYGVFIEETSKRSSPDYVPSHNEKLTIASMSAAVFFYEKLRRNVEVRRYLTKRGIMKLEIVQLFKIGYAPTMYQLTIAKNMAIELGLRKKERDRLFFINRIIFPIQDSIGRVIGYAGRVPTDEKTKWAKYINSPDTVLYKKSDVLYGLHQSDEWIRTHKEVFIVEGYLDVILLYQAGIKSVVAPCGTQLTESQAKILARKVKSTYLMFDGDEAGQKATFEAMKKLFAEGIKVQVLKCPENEDPGSLALKYKNGKAITLACEHLEPIEFLKGYLQMEDVEEFCQEALGLIQLYPSPIYRDLLVRSLSEATGVSQFALNDDLSQRLAQVWR